MPGKVFFKLRKRQEKPNKLILERRRKTQLLGQTAEQSSTFSVCAVFKPKLGILLEGSPDSKPNLGYHEEKTQRSVIVCHKFTSCSTRWHFVALLGWASLHLRRWHQGSASLKNDSVDTGSTVASFGLTLLISKSLEQPRPTQMNQMKRNQTTKSSSVTFRRLLKWKIHFSVAMINLCYIIF